MPPPVVVFGASWAQEGDALYKESERLGAALARAGFGVCSGGYGGTMEGVSRGAAEAVPSSEREGVIVSSLFPYRDGGGAVGNAYLNRVTDEVDLLARIRTMTQRSRVFVVMRGTLGTLTEVACVWNMAALRAQAGQPPLCVLVYRDPWEAALKAMGAALGISDAHMSAIRFVDDAEGVVTAVQAFHASEVGEAEVGGAAAQ